MYIFISFHFCTGSFYVTLFVFYSLFFCSHSYIYPDFSKTTEGGKKYLFFGKRYAAAKFMIYNVVYSSLNLNRYSPAGISVNDLFRVDSKDVRTKGDILSR